MKAIQLKTNYFLMTVASFVFVLFSFAGYSQEMAYEEADANQDGKVETVELKEAISTVGMLAKWDTDENGYFNDREFYVFLYRLWDHSHDGNISEEEWKEGITHMEGYDENEHGTFKDWDADNNGKVDFNEFTTDLKDNNYFRSLDMNEDQKLSDQEVANAVIQIWDEDDDGNIERIEYGNWSARLDEDDN